MCRIFRLLSVLLIACSSSNNSSEPAADTGTPPNDTGSTDSTEETSSDPLTITTDKGPVRGAASGSGAAFFNIPFASAERFAAPVAHAPWTDVRDASKRGPACSQDKDAFSMVKPEQSEDCLALNVWTPSTQGKAPVMMFIHGGSFTSGSGNLPLYDGGNLQKRGVVVVTINYRLGAFGFLAHPELSKAGVTGNQGFLDQVAALKWVQANIAKFGGDASNVTIFGESAGAISVCLHVVSPASKGLFHKAISQSGSCSLVSTRLSNTTAAEDSAEDRGARLARELGCETDSVACMRKKTVDEILAKSTGGGVGSSELGFGPNIDGTTIGAPPLQLLLTKPATDVPYLMGVNGDEATLFTSTVTITTAAEYEARVRALNPPLADELLKIYPASGYPTPKDAYNALLGEALFVCPARWSAAGVSARKPVYLYQFTQLTDFGKTYKLGAFHASELWFVFGNFAPPIAVPSADEKAISDAIGGYWTRFAKNGDPNGDSAVAWPKYSTTDDQHLVFNTPIVAGKALAKDRCDALAKLGGG